MEIVSAGVEQVGLRVCLPCKEIEPGCILNKTGLIFFYGSRDWKKGIHKSCVMDCWKLVWKTRKGIHHRCVMDCCNLVWKMGICFQLPFWGRGLCLVRWKLLPRSKNIWRLQDQSWLFTLKERSLHCPHKREQPIICRFWYFLPTYASLSPTYGPLGPIMWPLSCNHT